MVINETKNYKQNFNRSNRISDHDTIVNQWHRAQTMKLRDISEKNYKKISTSWSSLNESRSEKGNRNKAWSCGDISNLWKSKMAAAQNSPAKDEDTKLNKRTKYKMRIRVFALWNFLLDELMGQ